MKIRAIDSVGDWKFGKGLSSYNIENAAIAENVATRIKSWINDCWFDADAGLDWARLLGSRGTAEEIALSVRATILESYGVLKCNSIEPKIEGRKMTLTFNIDTIYSQDVDGEVAI